MAEVKQAFESLSPIHFDAVPDDLEEFLRTAFSHAELILDSVPPPPSTNDSAAQTNGSTSTFEPAPANSAAKGSETLSAPHPSLHLPLTKDQNQLKQWGKPIKLSARDNPLGVAVYKMAAHDRHGAWFARRSLHQGIGFERMKKAMQKEFIVSLKVQEGPGSGAVRGISADRMLERKSVEGVGAIEVWQTSSAFPGPVTPRESVTLVLSSDNAFTLDAGPSSRHYLILSRPTVHESAPARSGLVKMTYESAELIREIPVEGLSDPERNPVEWLMITRSDPGGGIPRFMVERGTPASIVGDVVKWLDWACSRTDAELAEEENVEAISPEKVAKATEDADGNAKETNPEEPTETKNSLDLLPPQVCSAAPSTRPSSSSSSNSSDSFASAITHDEDTSSASASIPKPSSDSTLSLTNSNTTHTKQTPQHKAHAKELAKLLAKRQALISKKDKELSLLFKRAAELAEKDDSKDKAKQVDKNNKERKKQEDRYAREIAKIDAKREKAIKTEEQRERKAKAKDEVSRIKRERDEWRTRAEVAEREVELLTKQVEGLQRESTGLIARFGTPGEDYVEALRKARGLGENSRPESMKSEVAPERKADHGSDGTVKVSNET